MAKATAAALGALLVLVGIAALAHAETWIRFGGTIRTVNCRNRALVLDAPDGTHVFTVARNAEVFINSQPARLCTLEKFVGSYVNVAVVTGESPTTAMEIGISVGAAAPPALGTMTTPPVTPSPTIAPNYSRDEPSIPVGIGVGPAPW